MLWLFSSSMVGSVRFAANPAAGEELSGTVQLVRQRWFKSETLNFQLERQNTLEKGFGDWDYKVFVTPDQDCDIEFQSRHFRAEFLFRLLAVIFALGLVSALMVFALGA